MWNSDKNSALGLVHDTHVAVSIEPSALPGRTELAFSAARWTLRNVSRLMTLRLWWLSLLESYYFDDSLCSGRGVT